MSAISEPSESRLLNEPSSAEIASSERATLTLLDVIHQERSELQGLVARELKDLGLPEQRFDIQASFLTFAPTDLAIQITWPISMEFQGKPTGVIQIGAKKRKWQPQSRALIVFARLMDNHRLQAEIREFCRSMTVITREAVERRGGEWPRGWPRLVQRGSITVNQMPVSRSGISRHGKLRRKKR